FDRADFRRYALTRSARIPAQKALKKPGFQIQNENRLIFDYPGALGGKTGFTTLARHSYVGPAQRGGRRRTPRPPGGRPPGAGGRRAPAPARHTVVPAAARPGSERVLSLGA